MGLHIILGDITKQQTKAIVNAANTSLLGGGGVDGAIHRAAGPELLEECRALHGCKTGKAKLTNGYHLKADYVIHTPGPIWQGGRNGEELLLQSCYQSCMEIARDQGISSISFPSISTGVYRFPLEAAAKIAISTILAFLEENTCPAEVYFVCFDEITKKAYENAFIQLTQG